jgi:hypothetical protein
MSPASEVLLEGRRGEHLAGAGEREILVVDLEALLPAGLEERRTEPCRPRGVRVYLGGHVHAPGTRSVDHVEHDRRLAQVHAGDVADVDRGAGDRRVGDQLLHAL